MNTDRAQLTPSKPGLREQLGLGRSHVTFALVIGGLGVGELLIIALVLLFFFGAKRIPEIAKGLGGGIKSFKAELTEEDDQNRDRRLPPEDRDARGD